MDAGWCEGTGKEERLRGTVDQQQYSPLHLSSTPPALKEMPLLQLPVLPSAGPSPSASCTESPTHPSLQSPNLCSQYTLPPNFLNITIAHLCRIQIQFLRVLYLQLILRRNYRYVNQYTLPPNFLNFIYRSTFTKSSFSTSCTANSSFPCPPPNLAPNKTTIHHNHHPFPAVNDTSQDKLN